MYLDYYIINLEVECIQNITRSILKENVFTLSTTILRLSKINLRHSHKCLEPLAKFERDNDISRDPNMISKGIH